MLHPELIAAICHIDSNWPGIRNGASELTEQDKYLFGLAMEKKKEYDYRMPVWYTYGSREISYPLHLGRLQILPLAPQQKSAAFHLPKPALLPRWQRPRSL